MQLSGKIASIAVTEEKKTLSIRLRIDSSCTGDEIDQIRGFKGVTQRYVVSEAGGDGINLYFDGEIRSINITQGLTVTIHTPVIIPLLIKAVDCIGKPAILSFATGMELEIANMLSAAARIHQVDEDELLYSLTTYSRNGKTINGKRSINNLSEAQKKVIWDKLQKLLSNGKAVQWAQDQHV